MRQRALVLLPILLSFVSACESGVLGPADPNAPTDLSYQLIPSGEPSMPLGIVLHWSPPLSGRAVTYDVYSRSSTRQNYGLRATTTSPSFHDAGIPQLQYYVQALNEERQELGSTNVVTVDERNRLPAPLGLVSLTLNRAIQLSWDPNAYEAAPDRFDFYRVYSTSRNGVTGCDPSDWALEGTTVSDGFVARNLPNGQTRCFAVTAISRDGHESMWSNVREDTPRFDARAVLLDASDVKPSSAGFVFFEAATQRFGVIASADSGTSDFVLERGAGDSLVIRAARAGVQLQQYGPKPVSDLSDVDRAPPANYADSAVVSSGFAYVFRVTQGDGTRFAAVRVVHVARDLIVFDWSYQTAIGNPELLRLPGAPGS